LDSRHHQAGPFDIDEVTGKEEDRPKVSRAGEKVDETCDGNIGYPKQVDVDDGVFGYIEFVVDEYGDETAPNDE